MANTISSVTELAVDLEHHSYRSCKGFLALMQISTRQGDFVVDLLVPEVREGLRQAKDKSVRESAEARMANEAGQIIARVFADPTVIKVRPTLFGSRRVFVRRFPCILGLSWRRVGHRVAPARLQHLCRWFI